MIEGSNGWHADSLLDAYAERRLDAVTTASIEAHLTSCEPCRRAVPRPASDASTDTALDVDALWTAIVDEIDSTPTSIVERILGRLGVTEITIRLLTATSGLVVATILATFVTVVVGVVGAEVSDASRTTAAFIALAAATPTVGVAASFGTGLDPGAEIGRAAPLAGLRLQLLRTAGACVSAIGIGLLGSLALSDQGLVVLAWVLPALALSIGSLALATWLPVGHAAGGLVGAWLVGTTIASERTTDPLAPYGPTLQIAAVVAIAVAAAVAALRAPNFDLRGS